MKDVELKNLLEDPSQENFVKVIHYLRGIGVINNLRNTLHLVMATLKLRTWNPKLKSWDFLDIPTFHSSVSGLIRTLELDSSWDCGVLKDCTNLKNVELWILKEIPLNSHLLAKTPYTFRKLKEIEVYPTSDTALRLLKQEHMFPNLREVRFKYKKVRLVDFPDYLQKKLCEEKREGFQSAFSYKTDKSM